MFNYTFEDLEKTMNAMTISVMALLIFVILTIYTLVIGNVYCVGFAILAACTVILLQSKKEELNKIEKQLGIRK